MRALLKLGLAALCLLGSARLVFAEHVCSDPDCQHRLAAVGPGDAAGLSVDDSIRDDFLGGELLAGGEIGLAGGLEYKAFKGTYIDSAVVANRVRFRYDAAYDNPFPDRAEFFYAQCGCFGGGARGPGNPPNVVATSVDHQRVAGYMEHMMGDRLSAFVEMPFRFLNPESTAPGTVGIDNTAGLGDINAGFRYGIVQSCCQDITFQLRVYTPSGDSDRGLGTGHASIEPSILAQRDWTDQLSTFGEFRVWVPISDAAFGGAAFDGTVLRYGAGATYALAQSCVEGQTSRLDAVTEFVGWTVLDGQKFNPLTGVLDATGDTIVNAKVGGRWTRGVHSLAVSYGVALTDEVWYDRIIRAEFGMVY